MAVIAVPLMLITLAAIGFTVHAIQSARAFMRLPQPAPAPPEPVTLLKPLHGPEPRLSENLAGCLAQEWPAPLQLVMGTNRADDPTLGVARALPGNVALATDAPVIGANAKIANLVNMMPLAAHDLVILSDSDMAVPRDYVARVAAMLARPGVGVVTCAYHGRGDAGPWSRLAAAAIDWQFMPGVLVSLATGVDSPCMGSTIALRRATLDAIGGFAAFADLLADDYAIGAAVRARGLKVEIAPGLFLTHACTEDSLAALWAHELRWAVTIRAVAGARYLGVALTHPLGWAVLTTLAWPGVGAALIAVTLAVRVTLVQAMRRATGASPAPLWLLPARDLLSFAVYAASFLARSVDWRGARLTMGASGRIAADTEIS